MSIRWRVVRQTSRAKLKIRTGRTHMRFMVIVKATEDSEAGVLPTQEQFAEMGRYNDELVKAGVLLRPTACSPAPRACASPSRATNERSSTAPFPKPKS